MPKISSLHCMKPTLCLATLCKPGVARAGLFAHHLTSWRAAFCETAKAGLGARELRIVKDENDQLKRDLLRKEKALSEAAALLSLQKKFGALWEEEAK